MTAQPNDSAAPDLRRVNLVGLDKAISRIMRLLAIPEAPAQAEPPEPPCPVPTLDRLATQFNLGAFECDVLLLAFAAELKNEIGELCAKRNRSPAQPWPSFALAMEVLPQPRWDAMQPDAPLRRWRLVSFQGQDAPNACGPFLARVTLPEPVLTALLGWPTLDRDLAALMIPVTAQIPPTGRRQALANHVAMLLGAGAASQAPVVALGDDPAAAEEIAAAACSQVGMALYRLDESALPRDPAALDRLCQMWRRDSRLLGAALLVMADQGAPALARFIDRIDGAIIIAGDAPAALTQCRRPVIRLDPARVSAADRETWWRVALGDAAVPDLAPVLARMADQFDLDRAAIQACARAARIEASATTKLPLASILWRLARTQGRARLSGLAQRIEATAARGDLVLPSASGDLITQIIAHQRQRHAVQRQWRGAAEDGCGFGLAALFAGPSGTGKTMAAAVIAAELNLDLFRIDLSAVIDKHIGETEKNVRRLFDAAEATGAILLFDDADALFGRRSEVRDNHDRHADIAASHLRQRIETYRGIAILTTNLATALDPAFQRRLNYIVHFPFPDQAARRNIWSRIWPKGVETGALDWDKLGRLNLSGGQIRAIAITASILAAEAKRAPTMSDIRAALATEYAKQQRHLTLADTADWP